jgi:hypothetical protein
MRFLAMTALLACALPAAAQDLEFNSKPQSAFEAGTGTVDGAQGQATFLHALVDNDDMRRQGSELISWRPADAFKGKRIRMTTRLKSESATRSGCSLAAWNDSRSLRNADGPVFGGNADWSECSVVMIIPENATKVQLRYYLLGRGKVWSDGFRVEQVGDEVPETRRINSNMLRSGDDR